MFELGSTPEETKQLFKEAIIEAVTRLQGCKATELAAEHNLIGVKNLPQLLAELVKEGKILEVEYVLPNMKYRIKSFLLPAGTKVDAPSRHQSLQCQRCGSSDVSTSYGGPGGLS